MPTANYNAISYGVIGGQGFKQVHAPVSTSFEIKQGELVYLDAGAGVIKPLASDANAAALMGVALQPSKVSSNLDNTSAPAEKAVMVGWDAVVMLKTTAAEVYNYGEAVYFGADAQTITVVAGTNMIGKVILPSGVASITGAANVMVPVLVKSNVL